MFYKHVGTTRKTTKEVIFMDVYSNMVENLLKIRKVLYNCCNLCLVDLHYPFRGTQDMQINGLLTLSVELQDPLHEQAPSIIPTSLFEGPWRRKKSRTEDGIRSNGKPL